jgi:4-hydroxy-tetrahydrodipicolinate synthase
MAIFKGAGVAIVTPMHEDGSINYEAFGDLIEFQIANHTDAIIAVGTTGEAPTLDDDEHLEAVRFCVEKTAGRIPVIAGTGSNNTAHAIMMSKEAKALGADGLLLVSPYYNKTTQKGLIAHYTAIANAVKVPIILYNVPSRTGCNILPETVAYLCKNVPNIVGVKDAVGNISQTAKMMALAGDSIDLYSGNDDQVVPLLSLGGLGVISVLSNVAPRETHEIVQKFLDGDIAGSRELQLRALPLIDALFSEVNPIPVKTALEYIGIKAGPLRAPLTELEPAHKDQLKKAMQDFGLI